MKQISSLLFLSITLLLLSASFLHSFAHNNTNLYQYKIIPLNKKEPHGTKVLAGVANVRLKKVNPKDKTIQQGIAPLRYKVIDFYLTDKNIISNQKDRFIKYSIQKQQRILELEDILLRTFIVEFPSHINVLDFCKDLLATDPNVELAEPYYIDQFMDFPNDPDATKQSVLSIIQAFQAWDLCKGDPDVLIGVGDSGLNVFHTDLEGAIAINEGEIQWNGIDDDNNGYIDDYYGYNFAWLADGGIDFYDNLYNPSSTHGLDVTGIIGARTNNGLAIAGIGYNCRIVPMKVCQNASSDIVYGYQSMIYAAVRGCKVLNCS